MTLYEFLRHSTNVFELCIIRDNGWIIATAWIDHEDLFAIHPKLSSRVVKGDEWGMIRIVNKDDAELEVPCHYIDI